MNGKTIWENCREAPTLQRRGDPAVRPAGRGARRHRRAAREPGADRRRAEAVRRVAAPDAASRPRGRVREHRALQGADRRSRARRRRRLRAGAEELRAQGLSRHGGGRQHGPAAEAAAAGHHRHGADLRRADERHRVRHGGAARDAGSGGRRAARAGARRRHDRARRRGAHACTSMCPTRSWRAAAPRGRPPPPVPPAATRSCTSTTSSRRITGADFDFLVGCRGHEIARESH